MGKLKKNLGLQTAYQILTTITPLITSPYLSRVLKPEGLGVYSYTYSIVGYFLLIAMLGLVNYGSRTIAMAQNQEERSKLFCEIYALQLITSLIATAGYFITFLTPLVSNPIIALLQAFYLFACFVDVSWYFFGRDEFKITVTRNFIIKLLTIVALFVFVRSEKDLWIYVLIMAGGTFISQLILWLAIFKTVKLSIPSWKGVIGHLKPNLLLFVPILAMSVYQLMDKTLLGLLGNETQSGYYFNSDRIINIPLGVINGIGTVMLVRASSLRAGGKDEENKKVLSFSINYFGCVAIVMAFGIAAVSKEFVPIFFGSGYEECVRLTIWFAAVILFKTLSNIIRTQYLVPYNKEKIFIISVVVGAVINLVLDIVLIGVLQLGAWGAVIGTLTAEIAVCLMQFLLIQEDMKLLSSTLKLLPYLLFGGVMFIAVRAFAFVDVSFFTVSAVNQIVKLVFEVVIGGVVYLGLCLAYWAITKDYILSVLLKKSKK